MKIPVSQISATHWQPETGSIDCVVTDLDDVAQCINTILTTPLRSDPHRPDFGCDLLPYIDKPINISAPGIIQAAMTAINRWEQRVQLISITPTIDNERLLLAVKWQLTDGLSDPKTSSIVTVQRPLVQCGCSPAEEESIAGNCSNFV